MNAPRNLQTPPRVAVVMPAFNAAATISIAVQSVRGQTFNNWQLLIIDDGSTDATADIARAYCRQDPRISLLRGEHQGVSCARNLGIRESRGDVIAFLDADDAWHPDKLARHLQHLTQRPDVGVSYSQAEILDQHGRHTGQFSRGRICGLRAEHLLYSNPTTTTSTLVVRRTVFDQAGFFNTRMSFAEDLEWLIRASVVSGFLLEGLDLPLTLYRTNAQGLSSQLARMQQGWEALISEVNAYAPDLVRLHYRPARAEHLCYLARRALRLGGQGHNALRFLGRALAADWRLAVRQPLKVSAIFAMACINGARLFTQPASIKLRKT